MTGDPQETAAADALWRFSLALYARPGVADALIALQDRAGSDINLMLYALWLGTHRVRLHAEEFPAAATAVAPLNDTVAVLRRQRRQLRDTSDPDLAALRRQILGLELAAERRVQYRLAARLRTGVLGVSDSGVGRDPLDTARANLALYLGGEAASPEAATVCAALAALTRRF